jgi:hypothetical protein
LRASIEYLVAVTGTTASVSPLQKIKKEKNIAKSIIQCNPWLHKALFYSYENLISKVGLKVVFP